MAGLTPADMRFELALLRDLVPDFERSPRNEVTMLVMRDTILEERTFAVGLSLRAL